MKDKIVILNPDYHFKNDRDRIVMYSKKNVNFDSSADWTSYIHPMQAMILGLFTIPKTLELHCSAIEKHFHMTSQEVKDLINPYVNNSTPVYVNVGDDKVLFPKNVLIPYTENNASNYTYDFELGDLKCTSIDLSPERMHKAPHSILFMLTNKCVTKCKYCYADCATKYNPLTTEQILNIIENAHSLKVSYIDVIGGEIFCRKDWDIIISKLVEYDMSPSFISTKVPINQDIAERLNKTGYNNVIQLSLDSLDEEILKEMIGCQTGYIDKLLHGIELLQSYGFEIQIDTILTRLNSNKKQLLDLYSLLKKIKLLRYWEIRVPEVSIYTPDTFDVVKASKQQLTEICKFVEDNIIPDSPFKIYLSTEALNDSFRKEKASDGCFSGGACGALSNRFFILPDGKVSICEQLYWHPQFIIGDLKVQSIEEIWNSDKAIELFNHSRGVLEDGNPCGNCKILDFCSKKHRRCVVKVIKAYGLNKWNFPDPRCEYAPSFESNLIY